MIPIRNKRTGSSLLFILFVLFVINVVVMNDYVESFVISLEKTISSTTSSTTTFSSSPKITSRVLPYRKRQSFPLFVSDIESQSQSQQQQQPSTSIGNTIPTLSLNTTWMIRITLRNIKTQLGQIISNQMYVLYGQFISLENYEPPQGTFQQQQLFNIKNNNDTTTTTNNNNNNGIQITSSRWILSEDPNDRKDGLWIWGLFQQPLYPFMLLSFETKPIPILHNNNNNNDNNNEQDYIPALQLYVQLDHTCNRDTGAVSLNKRQSQQQQSFLNMDDNLSSSNVGTNYDLKIRQIETIAADPLSLSKVDIYEEVSIGTISIQPYK